MSVRMTAHTIIRDRRRAQSAVFEALAACHATSARTTPPSGLIMTGTGASGKTTLACAYIKLCREHKPRLSHQVPVAYAYTPPEFTVTGALGALSNALRLREPPQADTQSLRQRIPDALDTAGTELIIWDDASFVLPMASTGSDHARVAETLAELAAIAGRAFVLIGVPELASLPLWDRRLGALFSAHIAIGRRETGFSHVLRPVS